MTFDDFRNLHSQASGQPVRALGRQTPMDAQLESEYAQTQEYMQASWVDEPLADKLIRESYMLTAGTARGFEKAANNFLDNPGESALKLGIASAIGIGVSCLTRGRGLPATIKLGALAGMTAFGVKDSIEYLKPAYQALTDTYRSPANFNENLRKWEHSAGSFAFDTVVYGAAGGAASAYAGNKFLFGQNSLRAGSAVINETSLGQMVSRKDAPIIAALEQPDTLRKLGSDLALKPLNVASRSEEAIGRMMSNFPETPFTFRGREYASMEGFYHSLKFAEPELQNRVSSMSGPIAKSFGNKGSATHGFFQGESFILGTPKHHELVKDAIRAKLDQHPEIAKEFVATYPRPIVHDTGRKPNPKTNLPDDVFTRILSELREELFKAQK